MCTFVCMCAWATQVRGLEVACAAEEVRQANGDSPVPVGYAYAPGHCDESKTAELEKLEDYASQVPPPFSPCKVHGSE